MTARGLDTFKESFEDSEEWEELVSIILEEMKERVVTNGRSIFSDLSQEQRSALFSSIEDEFLPESDAYQSLVHKAEHITERYMQEQSIRDSNKPGSTLGKMEILVNIAGNISGTILERWPDRFDILRHLSFYGLPAALRVQVWGMYLRGSLRNSSGDVALKIAANDAELWTMCSELLNELGVRNVTKRANLMKTVISHLTASSKVDLVTPWLFAVVPLVATMVPADTSSDLLREGMRPQGLLDYFVAMKEGTGLSEFMNEDTCKPESAQQQNAWREFVDEVSVMIRKEDEKYYQLVSKVASSEHFAGQRAGGSSLVHHSKHKIWDLRKTKDMKVHGGLSLLLLPLVQRMFTGVFVRLEVTLFLWDLIFIFGKTSLPKVCAALFVSIKNALEGRISEASTVDQMEVALNTIVPPMEISQIQFNIDKFVRPHIMQGEKQQESRPRKLDLLSLAGDDAFAATSNAPHRPEEKDLPLIKVRRGHVTTRSQEVQTGPDVTTLSSRNEILSPSHGWEWSEQDQKAFAERLPSSQIQVDTLGEEFAVSYGGVEYFLRQPKINRNVDRVSSVIDKILNDPANENLFQVIIRLQQQVPSPVAKAHGQIIIPAKATRADEVIWPAVANRYPFLADDYALPMLRCDIKDESNISLQTFYFPPISGESEQSAIELVQEALRDQQRENLDQATVKWLAEKLSEYSSTATRRFLNRNLSFDPVGVSLTLDLDFNKWIPDPEDRSKKEDFLRKIQESLAAVLRIPSECLQMAGLQPGSIIVDFNIHPAANDSRTPMQLYEELAFLISHHASGVRQWSPPLSSSIRAHLRSGPHQVSKDREHDEQPVALPAPAVAQEIQQDKEQGAPGSELSPERRPHTGASSSSSRRRPGGHMSLERAAALAVAASQLQVGWTTKSYFFVEGKERKGPVDFEQLCSLYQEGKIVPETSVWYKSLGPKWMRLQENVPLHDAIKSAKFSSAGHLMEPLNLNIAEEIAATRLQLWWRRILRHRHNLVSPGVSLSSPPSALGPSPMPAASGHESIQPAPEQAQSIQAEHEGGSQGVSHEAASSLDVKKDEPARQRLSRDDRVAMTTAAIISTMSSAAESLYVGTKEERKVMMPKASEESMEIVKMGVVAWAHAINELFGGPTS